MGSRRKQWACPWGRSPPTGTRPSSVKLCFDKVFGDVHLSPCPLEQVLGDDRPPDRRGRGHNGSWRALVMYTCWWLGVIHSRAPLRVEHSLRKSLVKAKPLPEAEMSCHFLLRRAWRCIATLRSGDVLPLSEAEMQQRQQHNGNSHGISDSNNDSNTSRRQRQQQP